METTTYKIIFADNQGSPAVDALAASCEGTGRDAIQRYDGEREMAFIDLPGENAAYLKGLLDVDDNVISYQEVSA